MDHKKTAAACLELYPALEILRTRQWVERNIEHALIEAAAYALMTGADPEGKAYKLVQTGLKATLAPRVKQAEAARAESHKAMRQEALRIAMRDAQKKGIPFDPTPFADVLPEIQKK